MTIHVETGAASVAGDVAGRDHITNINLVLGRLGIMAVSRKFWAMLAGLVLIHQPAGRAAIVAAYILAVALEDAAGRLAANGTVRVVTPQSARPGMTHNDAIKHTPNTP